VRFLKSAATSGVDASMFAPAAGDADLAGAEEVGNAGSLRRSEADELGEGVAGEHAANSRPHVSRATDNPPRRL
jgi:hypothetical protein